MARTPERDDERGVRTSFWRRPGLWVTLFSVFALIAGAVYLYASPFLRIDQVEVQGAAPELWQRIRLESGLEGESMLTLDSSAVQERLGSIPAVKSVEIERKWPRTAVVKVTEREPWGFWEANGRLFAIDLDGVVLDHKLPPVGAPIIRQLGAEVPVAGDVVDPEIVHLAARLREVLPGATGESAAEFTFDPLSGLTVKTTGGKEILLGSPSAADYKIAVLQAAASRAREEGIEYTVMDLSHGERAILR